MNGRRRCRIRSGVSIAEVGVAAMLVGVVIIASLEVATAIYRTHRISVEMAAGPALAHALMSEIVSMPYDDPEDGSVPQDSIRSTFGSIDDFDNDNFNSSTVILTRAGSPIEHYDDWEQEIDVVWISPETGAIADSETGLKKITVTVFKPTNRERTEFSIEAYRSRDGLLEQPLFQDCTLVTWVGAELQLETSPRHDLVGQQPAVAKSVFSGTPIHNHVAEAVEEP